MDYTAAEIERIAEEYGVTPAIIEGAIADGFDPETMVGDFDETEGDFDETEITFVFVGTPTFGMRMSGHTIVRQDGTLTTTNWDGVYDGTRCEGPHRVLHHFLWDAHVGSVPVPAFGFPVEDTEVEL